MTLGEFAYALGAPAKWVQNAWAVLGLEPLYREADLWRMALVRLLEGSLDMPLKKAHALAGAIAVQWTDHYETEELRLVDAEGLEVSVQWPRFVSGVLAGLSRARTQYQERRRGRPSRKAMHGIKAAEAQGLDLGLLRSSLKRTPSERLRALDEDLTFIQRLRVQR